MAPIRVAPSSAKCQTRYGVPEVEEVLEQDVHAMIIVVATVVIMPPVAAKSIFIESTMLLK